MGPVRLGVWTKLLGGCGEARQTGDRGRWAREKGNLGERGQGLNQGGSGGAGDEAKGGIGTPDAVPDRSAFTCLDVCLLTTASWVGNTLFIVEHGDRVRQHGRSSA